jgi:pimeloyl-ACP methyl ester carboxylesterase
VKRLLLLAALTAVAAGCGGGPDRGRTTQDSHGSGPDEVWFYPAKGKPRSLVVFLHGYGGPTEETPANHLAWLRHLAAEGSDVIYPRYEIGGGPDPYPHLDAGIDAAMSRLGDPKLPEILIGYSRGARIAVDYAAVQASRGQEAKAVLAVFPGLNSPNEKLGPLEELDAKTKIVIMVGDRDTAVGGVGGRAILVRLSRADFPAERIQVVPVRSKNGFSATHLSVLQTGAGARDAFWKPADALIDSVR